MRRKGLLVLSAALILIGTVTACALNFNKIKGMITGDDIPDDEIIAYEYGTMEEYLAPAAGSPAASLNTVTQHMVTVSADPASGGTVTPSTSVVEGSTLTLKATANEGYVFKEWQDASGETVSTSASYVTPPILADSTYKAVFTRASYVIMPYASTAGNIKSTAMLSSSCSGGYATGGGTIHGNSTVTLQSYSNDGYNFDGWYYEDGTAASSSSASSITVGLAGSGADIEFDPAAHSKLYAKFSKKGGYDRNVTLTATITGGEGAVTWAKNNDISNVLAYRDSQDSYTSDYNTVMHDATKGQKFYAVFRYPNTETKKPFSTDATASVYEYYVADVMVEYDSKSEGVVRKSLTSSEYHDNGDGTGWANIYDYIKDDDKFTYLNLYIIIRARDASFDNVPKILTTVAVPSTYGTTSGDMTSLQNFTTTIKAAPYEGYAFDHWEWAEDGKTKKSTESSFSVSVTGQNVYMAHFKKAMYNVQLSKMDPAAGGIVKEGLGSYDYKDDAKIVITANEGYEFESCSYTTSDGITHTFDSSTFTIPDIKEDVWLNVTFKQTKFTVSAKPEPLGNEGGSYNKVKISTGSTSVETSAATPTVEIPFTSEASVTLTATPNIAAGYKFDKWVGTDGATSTDNPYTPPGVTKDVTYIAQFVKDKYRISVAEDPAGTGKAYVYDPSASGGEASNRLTTLEVTVGGQAKIAVDQQYKDDFLYWTTSTGARLYESEITINDIRADENFTAHFKAPIEMTVGHSPDGAAQVRMRKSDGTTVVDWSSGGSGKINTGDDIILEARSNNDDEYRFVKWQDSNGMTYTENPVKIVNVTATDTFTAIYESSKCKVTVNASPSDGGTAWVKGNSADFVQGFDEVDKGGSVTIRAVAETGHTFRYWEDSAGNRYTDSNVIIPSIGADTVFTAYFGQGEVNITVDVAPSEAGMVELDDNGYVSSSHTYQIMGGSYITLSAQSHDNDKYKFNRWEDSKGNFYNDNPLTLIDVTADEKFTAIFIGTDKETGITVKASPPAGGRVTRTVNDDNSITIKAQANRGYSFNGWYLNDDKLTESSTYNVTSPHDGDVYVARFSRNKNYNAKSDITDEHFANVTRIFVAPNYTVTRETIQQMAQTAVSADRARIGDPAQGSKDYGAYGSLKAYYEEKYSKEDDKSALLIDEMLVTTESESVSCVTIEDATAEEKAAQFVLGKFGDRYKFRILTIKKIAATEAFISSPHTYLLKDTGAVFQDNVFILYGSDNGGNSNSGIKGYDWVTCVADEAGTLRFTVPRFESGDTFIVVLTWPE